MKQIQTLHTMTVPTHHNILLKQTLDEINASVEIQTLWNILNVQAMNRLHLTDHGPIHFQIVANIALRIARIFHKKSIEFSVVKDFGLTSDHAEVIIFLASVLHDIGMSVARSGHEEFSIPLANSLLHKHLNFLTVVEKTIIISETLHAIISHRRNGQPVTIEAGIVRIADALDMSEGRSRIPYDLGSINIHSVSAQAIDKIIIGEGEKKPVTITVQMNNSAGIFQLDELLKEKLTGSGIEQYFEITAHINGTSEKKLLDTVSIS